MVRLLMIWYASMFFWGHYNDLEMWHTWYYLVIIYSVFPALPVLEPGNVAPVGNILSVEAPILTQFGHYKLN